VILAGDICYERTVTGRVLTWLKAAHAAGIPVLIGDPGRTYFPKTGLTRLAQYEVQTTRELEDFEIKRTGIWTFPD
jgi:predicted nicotinamide N-methyase